MKDYLSLLIGQFANAKGIKNVDINSQSFINEFSEWLRERDIIGGYYASFIDCMRVHPSLTPETCVETSKGAYDTITEYTGMTMITPYYDYRKAIIGRDIIDGEFRVIDSTPIIQGGIKSDIVDTTMIRRFLTQNPYSDYEIANWEQLHNSGESNITVGIYGETTDKDIDSKIKQLRRLKDKLYEGYAEDYATDRGIYYYAISSNRKVKTLARTR